MNGGVVVGGWGFVWAAYTISFAAFIIYGVILVTRHREEVSRARRNEESR